MSDSAAAAPRLHSFDVLRGGAILGVVLFHCAAYAPTGIDTVDSLFGLGKFGVQLFFLVSALTMCHMWEQRAGESNRTAKFYIRRFMRIAPLFWLAIALYLVANGMGASFWAQDGMTGLDVGLTALFLHGFWPHAINNVVPGGWSIAVEMTFYALFPLLIAAIGDRPRVYAGLAVAMVFLYNFVLLFPLGNALVNGGFGGLSGSGGPDLVKDYLYFNFLSQCPVFLIGCYLHFALRKGMGGHEALAAGGLLLLGLAFQFTLLTVTIALAGLVYLAIGKGFRSDLLEKFGRNSYAIYLIHFIVIQGVGTALPDRLGLAGLLMNCLAVSALCYALSRPIHHGIERHVARITRWLVAAVDRKHRIARLA